MSDEYQPYVCNDEIEYCATESVFPENAKIITETPYIILGSVVLFDLITPIIFYWVRMSIRSKDTGSMQPTNWVDVTSCLFWIVTTLIFVPLFGMYPFHWLKSEALDWTIAWYIINMIGDIVPAISVIFWFWYLFVAIGAGKGS